LGHAYARVTQDTQDAHRGRVVATEHRGERDARGEEPSCRRLGAVRLQIALLDQSVAERDAGGRQRDLVAEQTLLDRVDRTHGDPAPEPTGGERSAHEGDVTMSPPQEVLDRPSRAAETVGQDRIDRVGRRLHVDEAEREPESTY